MSQIEALARALCQPLVREQWKPGGMWDDTEHVRRHRRKADLVIEHLSEQGYRIVPDAAWRLLQSAANVALTPDGSHRLIEGYCSDCQGGCLRGFASEPVPFAEPSPFGETP